MSKEFELKVPSFILQKIVSLEKTLKFRQKDLTAARVQEEP